MQKTVLCAGALLTLVAAEIAYPQQATEDIRNLRLRDWQPRSMLVTKETVVAKPHSPAIDVHNHLGGGAATLTASRVEGYLRAMDDAGVQTVVNLDGGWGTELKETLAGLDEAHPGRFLTFALLDFQGIDDEYWDPAKGHHQQGFWMIYGIFLPDAVLDRLYRANAERLLFGLPPVTAS